MLKRFRYLALPLLALLGATVGLCKGPEQSQGYYDYSKGVDTYHNPLSLPDGFVADSLNVFFDANAPVTKRNGYTVAFSSKAYAFQQSWSYTDPNNNSWIIVRASDTILANSLSGGSSVKIATVSVNNLVSEVNAQGNAYFVDQTQGVYYWNGTATTYVSGSPLGSLITQFHGRVWVAGLAIPNGNQLYGSKYLDGTIWTTGINANDPVQFTVGLQDAFDNISALYPYLDTLYTFKKYATYALYGFDQTSFQISILTQECGCVDAGSIQTFGGGLKFVSLRGVEDFNGYSCTRISDPIKNKIDQAIQQGSFVTQSWVQQNTTDWNAGTISNGLSTTISPPALTVSTFSITENTPAQWSNGTLNNVMFSGNTIVLSTNSVQITNNSFESTSACAAGNCANNWTYSNTSAMSVITGNSTGNCGTLTPQDGNNYVFTGINSVPTATLIYSVNSSTIASQSVTTSACSWSLNTITVPSNVVGNLVKLVFSGNGNTITSTAFMANGNSIQFYGATTTHAGPITDYFIDNVTNGPASSITQGTFTSQAYNTGITSATYLTNFSYTVNTATPTFAFQTSTSATGPWFTVTTASGTTVSGNQFVRYMSTITISATDNALTAISSVAITGAASTGTFKSQVKNIGSINSFGNFSVTDILSGGNIAFSVCTSSVVAMTPSTCTVQSPNTQITNPPTSFVQWYATFTVTAATQTATLNAVTVQWFSGNRATPMSSTVWDDRYWLSITTNTADTFNDEVVVLSSKGSWSFFDLHVGGLTQYKGSLYHSDSLATGNVYLDNQGYADNGAAINAFIKTKDVNVGDLTQDMFLDSIYPTMDNLGNYNVSVSYFVDGINTSYTLGTLNQTADFSTSRIAKLPFPLDSAHQVFGKSVAYKFTASDLNEPWSFYGFRQVLHSRPTQ